MTKGFSHTTARLVKSVHLIASEEITLENMPSYITLQRSGKHILLFCATEAHAEACLGSHEAPPSTGDSSQVQAWVLGKQHILGGLAWETQWQKPLKSFNPNRTITFASLFSCGIFKT